MKIIGVVTISGIVIGFACASIVDTCACSTVPKLDITPDVASIRLGDSVPLMSSGPHILWLSSNITVVTVSDTAGADIFANGVGVGSAVVIGSLEGRGSDTVRVTVTP